MHVLDHSASLIGIADQLGDSPFGIVHRRLAPSFCIVVLAQHTGTKREMVNTRFNGVRHVAPVNAPVEEFTVRGSGRGRGRSFNEVTNFIKKVEGVRRDGQAKTLAKRAKNSSNFQGSYSKGSGRPTLASRPIQSAMPACTGNYSGTPPHNLIQDNKGDTHSAGSISSFDRTCYNCGELGHMRRDYPYPRMMDSAQQLSRVVVPAGNGNNGR
uniref:'chromo' domain containing protein n=1 Tax=Solanum tuberosum TaxID=4113 RepID=M1DVA5_SOLTU